MKPNTDKIDDAVLALLHLTSFTEGKGELAFTRAWKGHDWEALNRLSSSHFVPRSSLASGCVVNDRVEDGIVCAAEA